MNEKGPRIAGGDETSDHAQEPFTPEIKSDLESAREIAEGIGEELHDVGKEFQDMAILVAQGHITQTEYDQLFEQIKDRVAKTESHLRGFINFFNEHSLLRQTRRLYQNDRARQAAQLRSTFKNVRIPVMVRDVLVSHNFEEDQHAIVASYIKEHNEKHGTIFDQWSEVLDTLEKHEKEINENIRYAKHDNDPLGQIPGYQDEARVVSTTITDHIVPLLREIMLQKKEGIELDSFIKSFEKIAVQCESLASAHHARHTAWLPPHHF